MDIREKIEELTRRINELAGEQTNISRQLVQLINELEVVKQQAAAETAADEKMVTRTSVEITEPVTVPVYKPVTPANPVQKPPANTYRPKERSSSSFEEFIGKNVASKVGILVTIIGIFIGAKYAIEHDMVSPVVRIIAGYFAGVILVALAVYLKKKYEAYSAVLMGGGLAVLYFITYIAWNFYSLLPQLVSFGLMLVFTVAAIYAALVYNRVIIAHLGQVGAYAIPFLLSDNSGRFAVLFTYIAIINTGILFLSFLKYWKSLFYAAFFVTWLIYSGWYVFEYRDGEHFNLALLFLSIYFIMFYVTFLAYKLVKKEQYNVGDVIILLWNAFIFYGIGYDMLSGYEPAIKWQGLFTVVNAAIHFLVSQVIRRLKLADRSLYYLVLGLVIVFLTIAVPVQFDGNWVTLLWTSEAVLVFIIGRTRRVFFYEKLGAGLTLLGFLSLLQDWYNHVDQFVANDEPSGVVPFLNIAFVTGLFVAASQGLIIFFNSRKKYNAERPQSSNLYSIFYNYIVPVFFLVTSYFAFQLEIYGYFQQVAAHVHGADGSFAVWGGEVQAFEALTLLLYSMWFAVVVIICNQQWIKNKRLGEVSIIGIIILMVVLLLQGLAIGNDLSVNYYQSNGSGLYFGFWNAMIRYVVILTGLLLLYLGRRSVQSFVSDPVLCNGWSLIVHTVVLGLLSAEYIHWTRVGGADNQYKLGLSILWGLYALFLIIRGIQKKLKHLRLAAIVLFSVTLVKLFIYDLAEAGTITKTVSFITLGAILLLVSYLYNRYKEVLFGDDEVRGVK